MTSRPISPARPRRLPSMRRALTIWLALGVLAVVLGVASLLVGSVRVGPAAVFSALLPAQPPDLARQVILSLRLPRALSGFACGALLSLAGATLQILLRNPLADPYVLGVSGGAAVFALAAMLLMLPFWSVNLAAAIGALCALAVILLLARRAYRARPGDALADGAPTLLLAGVVMASGWGALITLMLSIASDTQLRGMVFWLTGDLNGAVQPWPACGVLMLALVLLLPVAPQLNVLMRGDLVAQALGVPVARLRWRIIVIASLSTAAAVTTAGTIGFVGLVVPHLLRLLFGNDQRMLLPAAALGGGVLTMAADLLARTLVAPMQLPVGALTAAIGVPLFIWMLVGRRTHG